MVEPSACRIAQLTPSGRGAIATLLLSGADSVQIASRFFHSASGAKLARLPIGRIAFGTWKTVEDSPGEELVVCRTSETDVEIHCHGGQAAIEAIRQSLMEVGCESGSWQEVARQFSDDPLIAEARIALASATTQRTASILLDQLHGALRRGLEHVLTQLSEGNIAQANDELLAIHERACIGRHLTSPFQVVVAGLPNVGKSSLTNVLLGYTRAIVFDQPGTTRDVLTGLTALDGWPVELSDTAGVRNTDDEIESQGVLAARRRLSGADLVVLVLDGSTPPKDEERQLTAECPNALIVHNKCDLPTAPSRHDRSPLPISAVTGQGIDALMSRVVQRLVPKPPQPDDAVPFTDAQSSAVELALQHIDTGDLPAAVDAINELLCSSA